MYIIYTKGNWSNGSCSVNFRIYFHVSPIVPSLMLRSKNFSSIFKHVWCYALRYSLQLSNILEATFQDLYFKFETSVMLHAKIFASNFPTSLTRPSSMLRSKIFFSNVEHHWPLARRSSFQFCTVTSLMLRSWIFSSPFYYHWRYVPRFSLVFSNMPRSKI